MEYEIYLLCNLLGVIILFLVILFHFIDADSENSKSYEKEINTTINENDNNNDNKDGNNNTDGGNNDNHDIENDYNRLKQFIS